MSKIAQRLYRCCITTALISLHLIGNAAVLGDEKRPATNIDVNRPLNPRGGPVFEPNIERPLRYRPEETDFVIENGTEFFNRPLYATNSAFRVDAGDKP